MVRAEAVLGHTEAHWKGIRHLVEEWVRGKWDGWQTRRPPWMTDGMMANVPEDMKPGARVRVRGRKKSCALEGGRGEDEMRKRGRDTLDLLKRGLGGDEPQGTERM